MFTHFAEQLFLNLGKLGCSHLTFISLEEEKGPRFRIGMYGVNESISV